MRHGRAKASRKTLQFYRLNASNFRPPYKVILDGTFLVASIRNKVPLYERFTKILQCQEFTCYVTRSTLVELESLSQQIANKSSHHLTEANKDNHDHDDDDGDDNNNVFYQARQYGLDECEIIENVDQTNNNQSDKTNHSRHFSNASNDIFLLATEGGNNRRAYFVATQDDALSDALRRMPFVPLLRIGRAVLLLESPSSASRTYTRSSERAKLQTAGGLMTEEERRIVDVVKRRDVQRKKERDVEERKKLEKRSAMEMGLSAAALHHRPRKKKKAKGPNPLSCKKKKT